MTPGALTLDLLDDEARQRAADWRRSVSWHWIDAVAWVAARDESIMALLAGYRDFRDRFHSTTVGEGACRKVLEDHIHADDLTRAERQLIAWAKAGALSAAVIETGEALPAANWYSDRVPVAYGGMPDVLLPAAALRRLADTVPTAGAVLAPKAAPIGREEWEQECRRVAALLDNEGIGIRDASAVRIAERWNPAFGDPAKKDAVHGFMQGKPKGRGKGARQR